MSVLRTGPVLLKANRLDLCTETFGDPSAPALVLIMGLGAQMIAWDDGFCEGLATNGYHVIRFDNRDIGKSTRLSHLGVPNTMALMADMAADTVGLLDALHIQRAHIVGASMGGAIAQELAIHFGDRLRTMTSIMASSGDPLLPPPSAEAMAVLFATPPLTRDAYLAHFVKVLRVLRGPHFPEDQAGDADRAINNFERGINPAGVARQLAAIFASGNRTAGLARVTVPSLILHGDVDPLVRVACGRATARAIPGAKLIVYPGMGHSLPKALWPTIIDAISGHAR
jgi:pimeloyl-ACP methyl ester carboxylesterase